MKNVVKIFYSFLFLSLFIISCKKEETKKNEPTPTPAPTPVVNPLTATVSGTAFTTSVYYNNGIKDIYSIFFSKNAGMYNVYAVSGTNKPTMSINIPYGTGTYTITNTSTVTASYSGYYNAAQDTMTNWDAITGVINITQFDTNGAGSNYISKLKGTFTFSTALNKNITHNVTAGNIDYAY